MAVSGGTTGRFFNTSCAHQELYLFWLVFDPELAGMRKVVFKMMIGFTVLTMLGKFDSTRDPCLTKFINVLFSKKKSSMGHLTRILGFFLQRGQKVPSVVHPRFRL